MAKKPKAKKKAAKNKRRVKAKIKPKKKAAKKKAKKKSAKKAVASKSQARSQVNRDKKSPGAPVKYDQSFDGRAERYIARYGMNVADMAKEFGVSTALVYRWLKQYETFAAAVEAGRELMSAEIEHGLRQVAVPHDEVIEVVEVDTEGETSTKTTTKKGVINGTVAIRIMQASDERYRANVKLEGGIKVDVVQKLLKEIDGTEEGLPTGS